MLLLLLLAQLEPAVTTTTTTTSTLSQEDSNGLDYIAGVFRGMGQVLYTLRAQLGAGVTFIWLGRDWGYSVCIRRDWVRVGVTVGLV